MGKKPHPPYFWWSWWMPLQGSQPGESTVVGAAETKTGEDSRALKDAQFCLKRAGERMREAGLLEHPIKVRRFTVDGKAFFRLTLIEKL